MIGIIIINFGNPGRTIRFVREECSKVKGEHRTVVVDNGSGPEALAELQAALGQEAEIIPAGENLGFARGNNLGAEYAIGMGADLLLFVNNDMVFTDADVVDSLAARLESLPDAGMIGPKVVGLDGKLQSPEPYKSFCQNHLLPYWGKLVYGRKALDAKMQKDYAEKAQAGWHYRIMGSFMMMRAADFTACGGMDPNTFLYSEEAILSERLKRIGRKVWYEPSVQVLHEHGATITSHYGRVRRRRMKLDSDIYYYKNYKGERGLKFAAARLTYALKALFGL